MRKNRKKFVIVILLIIIILILVFKSFNYQFLQEDLLFFQIFQSKNQLSEVNNKQQNQVNQTLVNKGNTNVEQLNFNVRYNQTKCKAINLQNTINNNTLVYEKIAPGTNGGFDIILNSNKTMNYKIYFKSENAKPAYLQFFTSNEEDKYKSLEELGECLQGSILRNEQKKIHVYWEWIYESNNIQNFQDTIDAKQIREYNFVIYVQGY